MRVCGLCKGATDTPRKEIMASLPANTSAMSTKQQKAAMLEPDALEAGRNPKSITNGAGLSLGMGNLK